MAWLDDLFRLMVSEGASDLHISSDCVPMLRLHGDMVEVPGHEPIDPRRMEEVLEEITPTENQNQFDNHYDTDFAYELPGAARFRVNLFVDRKGPGAVFRQIPSEVLTAEQLDLPTSRSWTCAISPRAWSS